MLLFTMVFFFSGKLLVGLFITALLLFADHQRQNRLRP